MQEEKLTKAENLKKIIVLYFAFIIGISIIGIITGIWSAYSSSVYILCAISFGVIAYIIKIATYGINQYKFLNSKTIFAFTILSAVLFLYFQHFFYISVINPNSTMAPPYNPLDLWNAFYTNTVTTHWVIGESTIETNTVLYFLIIQSALLFLIPILFLYGYIKRANIQFCENCFEFLCFLWESPTFKYSSDHMKEITTRAKNNDFSLLFNLTQVKKPEEFGTYISFGVSGCPSCHNIHHLFFAETNKDDGQEVFYNISKSKYEDLAQHYE